MKRALFRRAHGSYSFSLLTVPTETGACPSWNGAVSVLSCVDNLWKIWLWALCLELQDKPCNSWQEKVPLSLLKYLMYNKQPLHCKCFLIYLTWLLVGGGERFAAVSDEGLNTNPDVGQAHTDGADTSWLPTAASSSCISQHCAEASSPHSGQADEFGCSTAGKPLVIHTASCAIWTHELGSPNLRDICVGW